MQRFIRHKTTTKASHVTTNSSLLIPPEKHEHQTLAEHMIPKGEIWRATCSMTVSVYRDHQKFHYHLRRGDTLSGPLNFDVIPSNTYFTTPQIITERFQLYVLQLFTHMTLWFVLMNATHTLTWYTFAATAFFTLLLPAPKLVFTQAHCTKRLHDKQWSFEKIRSKRLDTFKA